MNGVNVLADYLGKVVNIEVSGNLNFIGYLIDFGPDIVVINNGREYVYLPTQHIHAVKQVDEEWIEDEPDETNSTIPIENGSIDLRKILENARGRFIECYITGNHALHGYITQLMDDYFVFYSPVYHTVFISTYHLKYFIPYYPGTTPYGVDKAYLSIESNPINFAPTFEELFKTIEGRFIVMDLGGNPNKTGFFKGISKGVIKLATANGEIYHWNIKHIKTVHLP